MRTSGLRLAGVLAVLHVDAAAVVIPTVCGGSGDVSGGSRVVTADGRASLGAPLLCSSYACRAALVSETHAVSGTLALTEHLLDCALPSTPGPYEMIEAKIAGLSVSTEPEWLKWFEQAFEQLGSSRDTVHGGTYFPVGAEVQFYVATTRGFNDSGIVTAAALQNVLDQMANPNWASGVDGYFGAASGQQQVRVTSLRASPVRVSVSAGEVARAVLLELKVLAAAFAAYVLTALVAHYFGPPWLVTLVLCWPEVCDGRGCPIYRVLCGPLVLIYHAFRIYCWSCCMSYVTWMGRNRICKTLFWHEFTDQDFPPNDRAIGQVKGDSASGIMNKGGVAWAKASDIAARDGQQAHLFQGDIEPGDVLQGALGDCWLMAGLACVAERPEILEQAIITKHVDPRGKYHFRLWNQVRNTPGTKWVDLYIDENIPVHPGTLQPKFARTHCNEMWVLLLEKAFAKMYGGYDRLDGGQMSWALTAITGNVAVTLLHSKIGGPWTSGKESLTDNELFTLLMKLRRNGAFLCCAMIAQSDKKGLIDGHAYSIIQLATVRTSALSTSYFRMVRIRNPHGQTEWQGAWSDKDPNWDRYPHVRSELSGGADRTEDGAFWMQWEDFVKFWKEVQIVDCETSIRTIAPPSYNETVFGPTLACFHGCLEYWCLCLGIRRLYLGRSPASDLKGMEEGIDRKIGYDQEGLFCDLCDLRATASDEYGHADDHHEVDEHAPLCPWTSTCGGSHSPTGAKLKVNSRAVSRSGH